VPVTVGGSATEKTENAGKTAGVEQPELEAWVADETAGKIKGTGAGPGAGVPKGAGEKVGKKTEVAGEESKTSKLAEIGEIPGPEAVQVACFGGFDFAEDEEEADFDLVFDRGEETPLLSEVLLFNGCFP